MEDYKEYNIINYIKDTGEKYKGYIMDLYQKAEEGIKEVYKALTHPKEVIYDIKEVINPKEEYQELKQYNILYKQPEPKKLTNNLYQIEEPEYKESIKQPEPLPKKENIEPKIIKEPIIEQIPDATYEEVDKFIEQPEVRKIIEPIINKQRKRRFNIDWISFFSGIITMGIIVIITVLVLYYMYA
ncbi:MAG: hypothetical protein J7K26_00385 [Candidatus Aenigmarchaeota archaeon]|nr:hypothetical protein [Candidatus Aenigmarchaeota archaeon]